MLMGRRVKRYFGLAFHHVRQYPVFEGMVGIGPEGAVAE